jgi:hypothetical protein
MATANKAITTYLPPDSLEWLEGYCLQYKHLQNKEGLPKLGTAIAEIIFRLGIGELALPVVPDSKGTSKVQYGTEIEEMRESIERIKKSHDTLLELISENSTSNVPPSSPTSETIKSEIERALQPIRAELAELKKL